MLNREDVERIIENVLNDLSIEMDPIRWTDPNSRVIKLMYKGKEISNTEFNVKDRPEYDG